jgi:hypothetical protein
MTRRVEIATDGGRTWRILIDDIDIADAVTALHIHADSFDHEAHVELRVLPSRLTLNLPDAVVRVIRDLEDQAMSPTRKARGAATERHNDHAMSTLPAYLGWLDSRPSLAHLDAALLTAALREIDSWCTEHETRIGHDIGAYGDAANDVRRILERITKPDA